MPAFAVILAANFLNAPARMLILITYFGNVLIRGICYKPTLHLRRWSRISGSCPRRFASTDGPHL